MAEERIKDLLKITKEVFKKLEIFMEYNLLISDINHQKDINFALDKLWIARKIIEILKSTRQEVVKILYKEWPQLLWEGEQFASI